MPILTDVSIKLNRRDFRFRTTTPFRRVVLAVLSHGRHRADGNGSDEDTARAIFAEFPHHLEFEDNDNEDGFHVCVDCFKGEIFIGANFDKDSWGNTGFGGRTEHIHWEAGDDSTGADWLSLVN